MLHLSKVILAVITIVPLYGNAQQAAMFKHRYDHDCFYREPNVINYHFNDLKDKTARTTAATGSRLKAEAYTRWDSTVAGQVPSDSFVFNYSGTKAGYYRGSQWALDVWVWDYDSFLTYQYAAPTYFKHQKDIQTFDVNNNVITSVAFSWNITASTYVNLYQEQRTYDGMNNAILIKKQDWNSTTGSWDSTWKYTSTYDGAHNVLTRTEQHWNPSLLAWDNIFQYTFTYNPANYMLTSLEKNWNTTSSAWENDGYMVYTYDGSNNMTSEVGQNWNTSSGAWDNGHRAFYKDFTAHQPGTGVYQLWNGSSFDSTFKSIHIFNSDNQPAYNSFQTWSLGGWGTINFTTRFYYETYSTGTQNLSNAAADILIFPVPAKDEVSIEITWTKPQPFTVTLTDVQGRMYTSYKIGTCATYKDKIPVTNLPTGNYLITIEGASGKTTRRISIEK